MEIQTFLEQSRTWRVRSKIELKLTSVLTISSPSHSEGYEGFSCCLGLQPASLELNVSTPFAKRKKQGRFHLTGSDNPIRVSLQCQRANFKPLFWVIEFFFFASSMLGIPPVGAILCAHSIKHLAGTETSAPRSELSTLTRGAWTQSEQLLLNLELTWIEAS